MKICTGCRRHVRPADPTCPFCGEPLRTTGAVTLGVAVLLGSAACGPASNSSTSATGSSSDTTDSTAGATTVLGPTTTIAPSTSGSTSTSFTSTGQLSTAGDEFVDDAGATFYGASWSFDNPDYKECDSFAQDCPPGTKCSPYAASGTSWNGLKCVPVVDDPAQPGEPCVAEGGGLSGIDNCDLGAFCLDVDDVGMGTCVALCTGNPRAPLCADPTTTCAIYYDGILNLCLATCDPLAQDCPLGDVCLDSDDTFLCIPDDSGEEGQQHDPCEYLNECDPGLICLNSTAADECDPAASGCCQPYCDLTAPDPDIKCVGQGQACVPYFEPGTAPDGHEDVGYCAKPE